MSSVRIAAGADFHGALGFQVPKCDLLILAGDYTPLWSSAENQQAKREYDWWVRKFIPWLWKQKDLAGFEKVIIGGGNHDCFMEHIDTRDDAYNYTDSFDWIEPAWPYGGEATTLVRFNNLNVAVHSITSTIHSRKWPFSYPRSSDAHRLAISEFEDYVEYDLSPDIVVSHGPPASMLDLTDGGQHVGCPFLASYILEHSPKHVLCGHIHERRGESMKVYNSYAKLTKIQNVSIMDRSYSPKGGKFHVFDVEC